MKNALKKTSASFCPAGFTLIELILSIGLFSILFALLAQNTMAIYRFKEVIDYKKTMNSEMNHLLGNDIAGLIRSGFGIDYEQTIFDQVDPDSDGNYPDDFQYQVDQISIFSNSIHSQSFLIYREPYVTEGEQSGTARLMLEYSNGEIFPLHSSDVVIELFDIQVPKPPELDGDPDVHPYVELYVRARHRHPFGEVELKEEDLEHYQNLRSEYKTTYMLRN